MPMKALKKTPRVADCVQLKRVRSQLEELFALGGEEGREGAWRLAFSPADIRGRTFVLELMREADLAPRVDQAGNLIGVLRGSDTGRASLIIGSHIDTVPGGGMFDGALGVIGGIEVLRAMKAAGFEPAHPVEVIAFSNEEKARFSAPGGSWAMVKGLTPADLDGVADADGVTLAEAMAAAGIEPDGVASARRPTGFCAGYVELHVEQGGRMDEEGLQIGAVTAIVGITRARLTFRGQANHAGTTAMAQRQDALWAAADFVGEVRRAALAEKGELVGTVGSLKILPGAPSVIPGAADITVELRSADEDRTRRVLSSLLEAAQALAAEYGLAFDSRVSTVGRSVPLDPAVVEQVEKAAAELGLACRRTVSWAGHDASQFAPIAPTAMIFVPSIGGISHAPDERTSWEDVERGVKVLAATICSLDRLWSRAKEG